MKKPKKSIEKTYATKILRTVQSFESFRFNKAPGDYTGRTARNLIEFSTILKSVNIKSINFHFKRSDFQRWIQNTLGDNELSNKIQKITKDSHGEKLRASLISTINERIIELRVA